MKKIIIIAGALIVIVGGFFLIRSNSSNSSKKYSENITDEGFSISTGGGSISGKYEDPDKLNLGLSVYSGAILAGDQKSAGNFNLNGVKLTSATYQTDDSREKVEDFYAKQFGSDLQKGEIISGDKTYKLFKSKTNANSAMVNIWTQDNITYFTIFKTS